MTFTTDNFHLTGHIRSLIAISFLLASLSANASLAHAQQKSKKPWIIPDLSPQVLQRALQAVESANKQGIAEGKILGIIDFSLPSTSRRLWVLDLEQRKVLFHEFVAHGKGSGAKLATSFSNKRNSLKSSLGLYLTKSTYPGKHGYSLKLSGLEPGINDNAEVRDIVIHGAKYVSQEWIDGHGQLGRSWGCPAVAKSVYKPLIDTLKGGKLIFAYFPDKHWLSTSKFLNP